MYVSIISTMQITVLVLFLHQSPGVLQKMIDVCVEYAKDNNMVYNVKTCFCMAFIPKQIGNLNIPTLSIGNKSLNWIDEHIVNVILKIK